MKKLEEAEEAGRSEGAGRKKKLEERSWEKLRALE